MEAHDISAPWRRFISAWRAGDDDEALVWIREYIRVWDDAFWDDDFESFPAVYTDDVRLENRTRAPEVIGGRPQSGIDGFAQLREEMAEVARFFRFDIRELLRAEADRIVAIGKMRVRSRYAGLVIRAGFAVVWTLRDEKICRAIGYTSTKRALREAGLGPDGPGAEEEDAGIVHEAGSGRDLGD